MMTTASLEYKRAGIKRLTNYKNNFAPSVQPEPAVIDDFVNLFCEYQLADNNYMNIHQELSAHKKDIAWFNHLGLDEVLRLITYIIWTDRFIEGYITSKISDNTFYRLISRLEEIDN